MQRLFATCTSSIKQLVAFVANVESLIRIQLEFLPARKYPRAWGVFHFYLVRTPIKRLLQYVISLKL